MDRTYPCFGLWESFHREVCHDSLEGGEWNRMGMGSGKVTHKIVKTSLQTPEQVRVRRLVDISSRAIGQNQVVADDGIEAKTILIRLVGVPYP